MKIFIPRIEALMPLRENGKDKYLKVMAKIKDQLFTMERILLRQGYITNSRDIFFLTLEDLDGILAQRSTKNDILALVKKRKEKMSGRLIDKQRRQILYLKVVKEFLLLQKNLLYY